MRLILISFINSIIFIFNFLLKPIVFGIALIFAVLYFQTEIYDFKETPLFEGDKLYNPYQNWDIDNTRKANFHAHTYKWGGITHGHNTPEELQEAYKKKKYDILGISNYHSLSDAYNENGMEGIPVYEHGFNIKKSHKLAIGAKSVSFLDFPYKQNLSQKQLIISKIREKGGLVAICHPQLRHGHSIDDFKQLSGIQFIEILNPAATSLPEWDAALSNGKLAWCMGNDDTHNIVTEPVGLFFNLVGNKSKPVLEEMKAGNTVAVAVKEGKDQDAFLEKFELINNTIHYKFKGNISEINIIEDGKPLRTSTNMEGSLDITSMKHYIRVEAAGENTTMYLNPVLRYRGNLDSYINADNKDLNYLKTIGFKLLVVLAIVTLYFIFFKVLRVRVLKV